MRLSAGQRGCQPLSRAICLWLCVGQLPKLLRPAVFMLCRRTTLEAPAACSSHLLCECHCGWHGGNANQHRGLDGLDRGQQVGAGGLAVTVGQLVVSQRVTVTPAAHHQALQGQVKGGANAAAGQGLVNQCVPAAAHQQTLQDPARGLRTATLR